jgi:hypothetical protein
LLSPQPRQFVEVLSLAGTQERAAREPQVLLDCQV